MIGINTKIPEQFFREEERCEYIVSQQMKEVWAVEIDLMMELLRVCEKYNLKTFAVYGTKLGAVRHQGFIPWDDDIDLGMTREDFDRLCEVAPIEFREPYFFQTSRTEPGTEPGVAKLRNSNTTAIQKSKGKTKKYNQGIFLDIFVYDKVIGDQRLLKHQIRRIKRYHFLYRFANWTTHGYSSEWKGVKGAAIRIIHVLFGNLITRMKIEEHCFEKLDQEAQKYNDCIATDMAPLMRMWNRWHDNEFLVKNSVVIADETSCTMMPFEFLKIPVGNNYDSQLTKLYGNYMEFVKGNSCHGDMFFDTDKSYRYYLPDAR